MTARRTFSTGVKLAAFQRAAGRCEKCTSRLSVGKFQFDHVIADAMGGEPTLKNCEVLCLACHGEKTAGSDIPAIAKVKRVRLRHIGARRSASPMPGSRLSKWKRKMDGSVVLR